MTDPDANPDKPVPHGGGTVEYIDQLRAEVERKYGPSAQLNRTAAELKRMLCSGPEVHVPAEEVERFTEKYGAWKP